MRRRQREHAAGQLHFRFYYFRGGDVVSESRPRAGLTQCATASPAHRAIFCPSTSPSVPAEARSAYLHVPRPRAPNVRAEANLFIFSGVVLGLASPSAAALALRSRWFVLRGGEGGASAAGKQTSKNICSPLLEDEQSQSYIYPGRGDEKLFSYGRLNVPVLLPAFKGKRGSALEVMSYSWVVTRNLDAPHN